MTTLNTVDDVGLYRRLDALPLVPFSRNERWAIESESAGLSPGVLMLRLEWARMAEGLLYLFQESTWLSVLIAKIEGERRGLLRRRGPPRYSMMIGARQGMWMEGPVVASFDEAVAVVNRLAARPNES